MLQKLPRAVIAGLLLLASSAFAASMYLEAYQLDFLDRHPITVNLMSGVVGSSSGVLVVALGLNWFVERHQLRQRAGDLTSALWSLVDGIKPIVDELPGLRLESSGLPGIFRDLESRADLQWLDETVSASKGSRLVWHSEKQARLVLPSLDGGAVDSLVGRIRRVPIRRAVGLTAAFIDHSRMKRRPIMEPNSADSWQRWSTSAARWLSEDVGAVIQAFGLHDTDDVSNAVRGAQFGLRELGSQPKERLTGQQLSTCLKGLQRVIDEVFSHPNVRRYLRIRQVDRFDYSGVSFAWVIQDPVRQSPHQTAGSE